jgi:hypothetical protein
MADPNDSQILKLNQPGVVIEVDPRTAEDLGAFEEDAIDEAEALASAETDGRRPTDGGARAEGPLLRAGRHQAHRAAGGRDRPLAEALGAGEHPSAPQPGLGDAVQGLERPVAGDAGQGRPALDDLQAGQQRGRPGPPGREGDPGPILEAHRPDRGEGRARQAAQGRRGQHRLPHRPAGEAQGLLRRGLQRRADRRPAALADQDPRLGPPRAGRGGAEGLRRRDPPRPGGPRLLPARHGPDSPAPRDSFKSADTYYATALHELATGPATPAAWTGTWPTPSAASATPRKSSAPRSPP